MKNTTELCPLSSRRKLEKESYENRAVTCRDAVGDPKCFTARRMIVLCHGHERFYRGCALSLAHLEKVAFGQVDKAGKSKRTGGQRMRQQP